MTVITIQCRLQAQEETLRHLWRLMVEQNTLLVSKTLEQITIHSELDLWLAQGYIPSETIKEIVKQLKKQSKFQGMPGRFSNSAETLVKEIYKSWFAVQRRKRNLLWGKKRWLTMLKSEQELLEQTGLTLPQLQAEAEKILNREQKKFDKLKQNKDSETETPKDLFAHLFQVYARGTKNYEKEKKPHLKTKKLIKQCAFVYLLKNKCEISIEPEDPEKYKQYRLKKKIQLDRLEEQLKARLPKGRNWAKEEYLEALEQAQCLITENEEMELLQARLLRSEKSIPFPVSYHTNTDICWSKNERGRICMTFNGMVTEGHTFEVFCHHRQLHWFQRFYEDYQLYKQNKKQIPAGLITLRSASLVWQEGETKKSQKPWLTNRLYLHCSVETELWTQEGTEQIRQLKIAQTQQKIDRWLEQKSLNKNQQQKLLANQTSLSLLKTFQGFSRPSKLKPQQNSSLIMGVSIGLQEPVTVAIVNVTNGEIIAFYNTRQLLSKPIQQKPQPGKKAKKHTQYELFLRRRQQQQDNDAKRQHAQTKFADNRFGESELGIYVDRLLAKAIIEMAIQYQVSSIVLPDLTNIREILESEITARAEAKIPGCKKAQKLYAKKYRKSIHRWSYARLYDAIASKATQKGIAIEIERQIPSGTPEIQARDLALTAYCNRQQATG
ncbi:MAG: type V CRISPR-associated protein Cas12k [Xenococcaceae cyanobacterium MO_188.B29]|nr:type V CRISPR-associated protein Cas12k [Xenococcaceae cyanobacterium MO_188.B29]